MGKKLKIPEDLYRKLEVIAKERGVSMHDAIELLLIESYEISKAQKEGKEVMFLYDYGEKGFIVSMPADLPRRDPENKNTKVVKIEMPANAKYPEPKD
jgi:hypothetical protein